MTEPKIYFSELTNRFEDAIQSGYKFELLELHYMPYAFGSGMKAYHVNGRAVKLMYDGKDYQATLFVSDKHTKYSNAVWTEIYSGNVSGLLTDGIRELKIYLL